MTTTRSEINSNFYQIVTVDADGLPVEVLPEYVANANVAYANVANVADTANLAIAVSAPVSNVSITGGLDGYILQTDGAGNLSWTPQTGGGGGNATPGGVNTQLQYNNNGSFGGVTTASYNGSVLSLGTPTNITIIGGNNKSLLQTDGSGNLSWADSGNIININLDGSSSNVLYGNGVFAPASGGGNVANANYANFAGTAYSVSGSNVTGTVANATFATSAGSANTANSATVADSANSVAGANVSGQVSFAATANSVAVANVSGIGNIATVNLDGSASNVLYGNGTFAAIPTVSNVANANYSNFAGTAYSVSGANVSGQVANANLSYFSNVTAANNYTGRLAVVSGSGDSQIYRAVNAVVTTLGSNVVLQMGSASFAETGFSGPGSGLTNLTGANVTGQVSFAATANSVSVANVSGIGNIATVNLTGSNSNVLYGNGTFAAIPTVSNVANANYSNFAGTVITNAQPNITSTGTLTSVSVSGNANIGNIGTGGIITATGNISSANVVSGTRFISNIATGTAPFTVTSTTQVANLNVATAGTAGTVTTNSQPNITSVGTLASLSSSGVVTAPRFTSTVAGLAPFTISSTIRVANLNVATAGVADSAVVADSANSVAGANVSGEVSFAATANSVAGANVSGEVSFAATANSVAVANVSGIGNIATVNLDGNVSNVLAGNGTWIAAGGGGGGSSISNGTSNVNIATTDGNIEFYANGSSIANIYNDGSGPGLLVTGNITVAGGYSFIGDGSQLTGVPSPIKTLIQAGTSQVTMPTNNGNIEFYSNNALVANMYNDGTTAGLSVTGNVTVDSANYFIGNINSSAISSNTANITITMILPNDTSSNLSTASGVLGQIIAVSDQDGKLAYWDTGNSRYSYVFDNSAV